MKISLISRKFLAADFPYFLARTASNTELVSAILICAGNEDLGTSKTALQCLTTLSSIIKKLNAVWRSIFALLTFQELIGNIIDTLCNYILSGKANGIPLIGTIFVTSSELGSPYIYLCLCDWVINELPSSEAFHSKLFQTVDYGFTCGVDKACNL